MSSSVLLVNPRPRKGVMPPALKRYWEGKRRKGRAVAVNPRPKKGSHRRSAVVIVNPRHRHHSSNPRETVTDLILDGALGAGGGLALDIIMGYIPLPSTVTSGVMYSGIKVALGLGLGIGLDAMGADHESVVRISRGAVITSLHELARVFVADYAPQVKLGYVQPGDGMGYLQPTGTTG